MASAQFIPLDVNYVAYDRKRIAQWLKRTSQVKGNLESTPIIVFGELSPECNVITVPQYFIEIFRTSMLYRNDREVILTQEEAMIALQLCLANKNKQCTGNFDVEVSEVLDAQERITKFRLASPAGENSNLRDEEPLLASTAEKTDSVMKTYMQYLADSNVVDLVDILSRVKDALKTNSELQQKIMQQSIVVLSCQMSLIEEKMVEVLCDGKRIVKVQPPSLKGLSIDLNSSLTNESVDDDWPIESVTVQYIVEQCAEWQPTKNISISEHYAKQVILSYVHLLLNTRSELALANIINMPERDIDHKAFTDLKKVAQKKKMPLYQTVVSHVLRSRLGGSSYAPDPNCPLNKHVKGLSSFTDLMHKLQTIVEEYTDCGEATKRVVNTIHYMLNRCPASIISPTSLRAAVDNIHDKLQELHTSKSCIINNSPKLDVGNGGSTLGKRTFRILRSLLDHAASLPMMTRTTDTLTDTFTSQKTPKRIPCMLSKFRSPLEHSPCSRLNKNLSQRLEEKMNKQNKKPLVQRYQSNHDWALPVHHIGIGRNDNDEFYCDSIIPESPPQRECPIIQLDFVTTPKKRVTIKESANDQENSENVAITSTPTGRTASSKRKLPNTEDQQPVPKVAKVIQKARKDKTIKSKGSKVNKKLTIQKGQKKLTAFFRA